jgi:hypothetical protein
VAPSQGVEFLFNFFFCLFGKIALLLLNVRYFFISVLKQNFYKYILKLMYIFVKYSQLLDWKVCKMCKGVSRDCAHANKLRSKVHKILHTTKFPV